MVVVELICLISLLISNMTSRLSMLSSSGWIIFELSTNLEEDVLSAITSGSLNLKFSKCELMILIVAQMFLI